MYQRPNWMDIPLGRRILNRKSAGKAELCPAIIPELVNWLRIIGNRYVRLLENFSARTVSKGDAFLNSMRQTTEFRIGLIQDLINCTVDQFPYREWLIAWQTTCDELNITDTDCDPNQYVPIQFFEDGEGI